MSVNQDRGPRDFSKYDSMTMEELEEVLRFDPESPEDEEPDVELLLYVLEVRANKRKQLNIEVTGKTALEAYESFRQDYLPQLEEMDSPQPAEEKPKRKPLRLLRGLTAAAAVLAFVIFGTVTANAFGLDIWKVVATWAQETFHLAGSDTELDEPKAENELQYSSLQELLPETGLIPTWIPEGYELYEIDVAENPMQKIYVAVYEKNDVLLKITVQSYLNSNPEQIEQSEGFIEEYESSGIKYYFFSNYEMIRAAWINGSYECYISGELTIDELKEMIDSIGKG